MVSPRLIGLDRDYDARLLSALPGALGLFPRAALSAQFAEMAKQRRALCFTLIVPSKETAATNPSGSASAHPVRRHVAVLVCLHVTPAFAAHGPAALVDLLNQAARRGLEPIHQFSGPIARLAAGNEPSFYREAVYAADAELYVAITTHSPVEIPPETAEIVEQVTRGAPVDMVTTVSITADPPDRPRAAQLDAGALRPTIH